MAWGPSRSDIVLNEDHQYMRIVLHEDHQTDEGRGPQPETIRLGSKHSNRPRGEAGG